MAKLVEADPVVSQKIKVVFVSNYNVSYAEKLVAAADVSEQISTAGTEASGTGNMKLMLNGAVTLGTYDGANIEIVEEAGKRTTISSGAKVEELEKIMPTYDSRSCSSENAKIRRVVETLIDGTCCDGGSGDFGSCITRSWTAQAGTHRITTICWVTWNPMWQPSCAATSTTPTTAWHCQETVAEHLQCRKVQL